jgi:hypothetical protein
MRWTAVDQHNRFICSDGKLTELLVLHIALSTIVAVCIALVCIALLGKCKRKVEIVALKFTLARL